MRERQVRELAQRQRAAERERTRLLAREHRLLREDVPEAVVTININPTFDLGALTHAFRDDVVVAYGLVPPPDAFNVMYVDGAAHVEPRDQRAVDAYVRLELERRQEQQRQQQQAATRRRQAETRAHELWLMMLNDEQRESATKLQYIMIRGSHGRVYRINCGVTAGQSHNIEWCTEGGRKISSLCFHPDYVLEDGTAHYIPHPDAWLTQKLMLENDEVRCITLANYAGPSPKNYTQWFDGVDSRCPCAACNAQGVDLGCCTEAEYGARIWRERQNINKQVQLPPELVPNPWRRWPGGWG